MEYPAARTEITLAHRTRNIRTVLEGDSVAAMDNFGADLTFLRARLTDCDNVGFGCETDNA